MKFGRLNTMLAVSLVGVAALAAVSRVDYSRPSMEVLPDMKYTRAWTAFSRNPVFRNGRTLQAPVPGTIARGELPLHFEPTKEDAVRAGEELVNPYDMTNAGGELSSTASGTPGAGGAITESGAAPGPEPMSRVSAAEDKQRASVQRGGEVYRVFCISCHGPGGLGDGPVARRGFPPPPSLLTGKSLQMKDGQLFHILTYGQGNMTDFAAQLSTSQRWDVINHLRALQQAAPAAANSATPAVPLEPTADEQTDEAPQPPSREQANVP